MYIGYWTLNNYYYYYYFHHATSTRETQSKEEEAVLCFFYLEKAFDKVSREMVRWGLRKLGMDE